MFGLINLIWFINCIWFINMIWFINFIYCVHNYILFLHLLFTSTPIFHDKFDVGELSIFCQPPSEISQGNFSVELDHQNVQGHGHQAHFNSSRHIWIVWLKIYIIISIVILIQTYFWSNDTHISANNSEGTFGQYNTCPGTKKLSGALLTHHPIWEYFLKIPIIS